MREQTCRQTDTFSKLRIYFTFSVGQQPGLQVRPQPGRLLGVRRLWRRFPSFCDFQRRQPAADEAGAWLTGLPALGSSIL